MDKLLYKITLAFIIHMCLVSTAFSYDSIELMYKTMESASSYSYVREAKNNNRSPEIDEWHRYCGLPYGNPYCSMFVIWNYNVASKQFGISNPVPKYPRVATLNRWAINNPLKTKVISTKALKWGIGEIKPGQIIIWKHGKSGTKDNVTDWNGHTGIVIKEIENKKLYTIEGNTKPTDKGDQTGRVKGDTKYGNDGVYFRTRSLNREGTFPIINLIELR